MLFISPRETTKVAWGLSHGEGDEKLTCPGNTSDSRGSFLEGGKLEQEVQSTLVSGGKMCFAEMTALVFGDIP